MARNIKKTLDVDPVEAELVRLIFRLYLDGDGSWGPLGVKEVTKWLNSHEHGDVVARRSVWVLSNILRNACYATGKWPDGRRNSRTGGKHDPATIIEIPIPILIDPSDFSRAATKLVNNNPRATPPRVVNAQRCSPALRSVPPAAQA